MKKTLTTTILAITILFFNTAQAQTKEQIGQWLADSLKVNTTIDKSISLMNEDIKFHHISFVEYLPKVSNGVFLIFKMELNYMAFTGRASINPNIYVIEKNDIKWQKTSELKFFMPWNKIITQNRDYNYSEYFVETMPNSIIYEYKTNSFNPNSSNLGFKECVNEMYQKVYIKLIDDLSKNDFRNFNEIKQEPINNTEHKEYLDLLTYLLENNDEKPFSPKRIRYQELEAKYFFNPALTIPNEKTAKKRYLRTLAWMFEFCKP